MCGLEYEMKQARGMYDVFIEFVSRRRKIDICNIRVYCYVVGYWK
jgi:hypothetical protein